MEPAVVATETEQIIGTIEAVLGTLQEEGAACADATIKADDLGALKGAIKGLIRQLQNETHARKKAEHTVQQALERYQRLENTIPGVLYVFALHPDGTYSLPYVSQASRDLFGYEPEEIMQDWEIVHNLVHPDDLARFDQSIRESAETLQPWREVVRLVVKGETRWYDCMSHPRPLQPNGEIVWDGVVLDITKRIQAQARLERMEPLWSTVLPTVQDACMIIERDLTISYVNRTAEEHFQAKMPLVGRKCYEVFYHRNGPCDGCLAEQTFATGSVSYSAAHYASPSGKWYDVYHFPMQDRETGRISRVFSYSRDITERKWAEEALRESEERFRQLAEVFPETIFEADRNGDLTYVNEHGLTRFGYTHEDIERGVNLVSAIAPEDVERVMRRVRERLDGKKGGYTEYRALCKNGKTFNALALSAPILREGQAVGIRGFVLDITERKKAEEELQKSKGLFEDIIEFLPDATFVIDGDKKVIAWNRAMEEMTGVRKEDMLGQGNYAYTVAFYGERRKHLLDLLDVTDKELASKYRHVWKRGNTIFAETFTPALYGGRGAYVFAAAAALFDSQGNRVGAIESIRDITEHRRAEDALKRSEERFRSAFEQAAVGMAHIAPDFRYLRVNRKLCDIVGYTEEELLSKTFLELTHPDDRPVNIRMHNELVAGQSNLATLQKRYLHKNGSVVWVNITVASIRTPSGGEDYYAAVIEDISARKLAEERLRESEKRFRQLAEMLPEGIYELDSHGRIVYANSSALEHFGYSISDLEKGIPAPDLIIPAQREIAKANVQRILLGGETTLTEYTGLRKDGSTFPIMLHSAPVLREGKIAGARGVCVDMSRQKQLEAQLMQAQKMETVGRLAGGVAHDFNNMLAVILGNAELLQARLPEDDPLQDHVAEITNAALRSKDITTQLLAFSRRQLIVPKPLNLNKVILALGKTLLRLLGEDISLKVHAGKDVGKIKADPAQIDQVLMNLAVNARDAMPRGGKLVIETANAVLDEAYCQKHPGATPGAYVMVRVSDSGVGMDEEVLSHLFEPFFTTKEAGKGTGLGLATVYGIVKQNDGFIDVNSALGQGSTFEIFFPRLTDEAVREEIVQKAAGRCETGTVLLVEDNAMVRDITTAMLERLGHKVLAVTTPEEALTLCQKESLRIDLLLTDVVLPKMSGKELKERLEATRPGIKTLFMSGYPADVISRHGVLEPGTHFLQKPFKIDELREKIEETMARKVQ